MSRVRRGARGYDACVNRIRWRLCCNDLSAVAPDNAAVFEFVAQIK